MNLAVALPRIAHIGISYLFARSRRQTPGALTRHRSLPRHATLRLDNRALQLRVLRGCVWITRDGCPADWVLDAGSAFDQRPGACTLVHSLADAEVLIVDTVRDA